MDLSYSAVTDMLATTGTLVGAPEAHGVVCGTLCAHPDGGPERYGRVIFGPATHPDTPRGLAPLEVETRRALRDADFEFALLLPPESESLTVRFDGLVSWCQGFTLGLLFDDAKRIEAMPVDAREAAQDIMRISSLGAVEEEDPTAERELAEITEYVRVAVQLIYEELNPGGTRETAPTP